MDDYPAKPVPGEKLDRARWRTLPRSLAPCDGLDR